MYHGIERKKKVNPKEKANFVSLITFFFTYDLLKKGYQKDIEEEDVYEVIKNFKSSTLGDTLETQWQKQRIKSGAFSIFRLLWRCYGRFYLFWGIIQLIMKLLLVLNQPRALGKLVSYFKNDNEMSKGEAVYYAAVVIGLNIIYFTYAHNYMLVITELGIRVRTAFCSLIYRKALKLSPASLSTITIGKIVTLISKDVNGFDSALIFLNDMWISVILLVVTSILMYSRVGVAALAGVLFLVLTVPLQVYFGKLASDLRVKAGAKTDRRVQLTQETLSAIKIIKMYTWEKFFGDKIAKLRREEVKKIKLIYFAKATNMIISSLVISITLYIIITVYTALGNSFTAELTFFLMGCLQILRSTVTVSFPVGIAMTAELVASARRIHALLTAKEQPKKERSSSLKPLIQMENVSVHIKESQILNNINLKINSGFNFVTGRLGGGKSSLLKTILEIYPVSSGNLNVQGTISYGSEEPWLFPSSIRQNILFGQIYDKERYRKVLQVCALETDIDTLEKGDGTVLDDRGMNLSKGQQARISLARAVYCDSDIYLLDDCLSALDTHVQEFVFRECLLNFLKDKIVVMISHNEKQLKNADNVIIMENGTIKCCTQPSEIDDEEIEEITREEDKVREDDIIDNIKIEDDEEQAETSELLKNNPTDNIYHEDKKEGDVNVNVYKKYFRFCGSAVMLTSIAILFIISQAGMSTSDKLIGKWVKFQQKISEYRFQNKTNSTKYQELLDDNNKVFVFYSALIVISTVLVLVRTYVHFTAAGRASVSLHKFMVLSVINATMKFFDVHYFGSILNRFAKDLGTVDEYLPLILYECLRSVCVISGVIIVIATINFYFIIPATVIFVILYFFRIFYLPTGRSLKRLEAATRSPVIGHINASLEGLTTIRAYGTENILREEFDKHQDLYTSTFHMLQCALRFFAYFIDVWCNIFIAIIVITFLTADTGTHAGYIGVAITQAFALTGSLQWGIRQWTELENQMTSVERVLEYTDTEKENKTGRVLDNWPSSGKITYKNVNLTYGTSKEYVLKNINFTINPREKIGIVGRTGAGKSSLISTLFRLYNFEGIVAIDDVDIKTLALDFVRSNIAIIPQDPILFTGSIRVNIDPTGQHKDEEVWRAVEMAKLKELVPSLDYQITEGGATFSAGQRQLVCLARAIVSKSKIIILDEATSSVDPETDVLIYTTIQDNFAECTMLTIAHRLHTVVYSDKVMVVDKGQIVEFDDPNVLLNDNNGFFYKMVKQANWIK